MHSQFYAMNKFQYDAIKHFPWNDDDDIMIMMTLNKEYRETLRMMIEVKLVNMNTYR